MADKTTYNSDFCGVMADIEKKYVNKDSMVQTTIDSEACPNSRDATSLENCSNRNLEEKGRVSLLDHFSLGNYGGKKSRRQHEISASATVFKKPPSNSSLKRKAPMKSSMVSSLSEKYSPSCPIESVNNSMPLKKASLSPKNKKVRRSCFQYLLPPAMSKKTEACAAVITPDILRLLTSKERISLFNRKTGKIMRGEDSISLKNLPRAMQNHAEYEIMLPESACVVSAESRNFQQSRTSAAGRIRRNVEPQYTIRTSKLEGKYALIVDGPHKGLYGKVDACIPGDWYLLSNMFDGGPLEVGLAIHSKKLRLIDGPIRDHPNFGQVEDNESHSSECEYDGLTMKRSSLKTVSESIQSRLLLLKTLQEKKVTLEHEISRSVERNDNCVNKNAMNNAVLTHQDLEAELDRIYHQIIEGEAELQRHYFVQNILAEEDERGRK